jgi:hypothetical protein
LFRRELAGPLRARLVALGRRVEELTSIELTRATTVRRGRNELSAAEASAFAIAEGLGWPLLTGDGDLRCLAAESQVAFHGVLWICDQFEEGFMVRRQDSTPFCPPSHPTPVAGCPPTTCASASTDTRDRSAMAGRSPDEPRPHRRRRGSASVFVTETAKRQPSNRVNAQAASHMP